MDKTERNRAGDSRDTHEPVARDEVLLAPALAAAAGVDSFGINQDAHLDQVDRTLAFTTCGWWILAREVCKDVADTTAGCAAGQL